MPTLPELDWIDSQQAAMVATLADWANLNTGTFNLEGLRRQCERLQKAFDGLGEEISRLDADPYEFVDALGELVSRPLGESLLVRCRPAAPLRVLLAIHMDTVYGPDSPFQRVERVGPNVLRGPGVSDAKGGLVVILFALQAFEQFVERTGIDQVGWDVLLNADEEIGSPGSCRLFQDLAGEVDLGLLYEPALPDGSLVSARKGSGNFSVRVRGRSAHAGRAFDQGRNALVAAAELASGLHRLNGRWSGVTVNVAKIDGGGPNNVVPDVAVVRLNVRYTDTAHEEEFLEAVEELSNRIGQQEGIALDRHGRFFAAPKACTRPVERLLHRLRETAGDLGFPLTWRETGGVCDGNRLASAGVPNVDTLGVRGDRIHSPEEFILLDSLAERTKLTALLLMRLAEGSIDWPFRRSSSRSRSG